MQLLTQPLTNPPGMIAEGKEIGDDPVWTGVGGDNCNDFTSTAGFGTVGNGSSIVAGKWQSSALLACNNQAHVYCFQTPPVCLLCCVSVCSLINNSVFFFSVVFRVDCFRCRRYRQHRRQLKTIAQS
jgi:hypothetical protein